MPKTAPDPTKPCGGFSKKEIVDLPLVHGGHGNGGNGFAGECCVLEWVNRLTVCDPKLAEKYGKPKRFDDDHPTIAPTIRSFLVSLNDNWLLGDGKLAKFAPTDAQAILKRYGKKALGTKTTAKDEETRSWLATDWLARTYTPAWLRLAGLDEHARILESLARIADATTAEAAQPALDRARAASDAAWVAARVAASDAAWVAARVAASDAARDAAWEAASNAARVAASKSARVAAWEAASDAASDAARDAASKSARDAARVAAWEAASDAAWVAASKSARDAARVAAWEAASDAASDAARDAASKSASNAASNAAWVAASKSASNAASNAAWVAASKSANSRLAPTVAALQKSALKLLDTMIAVGRDKPAR